MKTRGRKSIEFSDCEKSVKERSYNITVNDSSYFTGSVNASCLKITKNPNLRESCFTGHRPKLKEEFYRKQKTKVLSQKVLTPIESREIRQIIEGKVKSQLIRAQIRLNKKIDHMNKIGIVPNKANQVRGLSLFSVESSFINKQIPNFKRIATSEVMKRRKQEKSKDVKKSRSELLQKIKGILLRDN